MTSPTNFELPDEAQELPEDDAQAEAVALADDVEALRHIEDLTLAELCGEMVRAPFRTWFTLIEIARTPAEHEALSPTEAPAHSMTMPQAGAQESFVLDDTPVTPAVRKLRARAVIDPAVLKERRIALVQLGARLAAVLIGLNGSFILARSQPRTIDATFVRGMPFLILAFMLWLAADVYADWDSLKLWWEQKRRNRRKRNQSAEDGDAPSAAQTQEAPQSKAFDWRDYHPVRLVTWLAFIPFALLTYFASGGNQFRLLGVMTWLISIVLVVMAFVPMRDFESWYDTMTFRLRSWRPRWTWLLSVLVIIFIMGAWFRLKDIDQFPPEMTSDHVEKLLDSQRILSGNPQIFFPNNGGREPLQMYLMALFTRLPGVNMDFTSLKTLSALEGLLTLPVFFWFGREIFGTDDRKFGTLVGVALMALVAVSYWHAMLSRLALRIVLAPLVTALVTIYLARAVRYNRRTDFIKTGLLIGIGMYTYQALRMLPIVVVIAVALAFFFRVKGWHPRVNFLRNFVMLVVVSFVVFVPMFRFSVDSPELFWMRAAGRLFGDPARQVVDEETGALVMESVSLSDRLDAFEVNLGIVRDNMVNLLLMFNWKGDVAWINGVPNKPEMDPFTGTLFIVGLAAWLSRSVRRREIIQWLLPVMLLVMLLPSALAIAFPIENPSATRTSGAIPFAYLIAALPIVLLARSFIRAISGWPGYVLAGGVAVFFVVGAYIDNTNTYFNEYPHYYLGPALPHSEAGAILRGFAESDGSYGNAFMISYPYWWDARALGIEAGTLGLVPGEMLWPNGIDTTLIDIPTFLDNAAHRLNPAYRLDPDRDLLFFYSKDDEQTRLSMQEWFPNGRELLVDSYQENDDFFIYRVPWLGQAGFQEFVATYKPS